MIMICYMNVQCNSDVRRIRVMFNPLALEEDVELPFGLCTVEVEDTGYHISCTGLESPPTEDMFCMSLCE